MGDTKRYNERLENGKTDTAVCVCSRTLFNDHELKLLEKTNELISWALNLYVCVWTVLYDRSYALQTHTRT